MDEIIEMHFGACKLELLKLETSVKVFMDESIAVLKEANSTWEECILKESKEGLNIYKAYDNYISKVEAVASLARKMSIEFQRAMLCDENLNFRNALNKHANLQDDAVKSLSDHLNKITSAEISVTAGKAESQPSTFDNCQAVQENIEKLAGQDTICVEQAVMGNSKITETRVAQMQRTEGQGTTCAVQATMVKNETATQDTVPIFQPTMMLRKRYIEKIFGIEEGATINIVATHIESVTVFYAFLDACPSELHIFGLLDDELMPNQKLTLPPHGDELVLAQYSVDHSWYRAKILSVDQKKKLFTVFFVDFGNTEIVSLQSLAVCPQSEIEEPYKALRCRLGDIYDVSNGNGTATETLLLLILDKTFAVKVLSKNDKELSVRIIDSEFADVPEILVKLGYVKEK